MSKLEWEDLTSRVELLLQTEQLTHTIQEDSHDRFCETCQETADWKCDRANKYALSFRNKLEDFLNTYIAQQNVEHTASGMLRAKTAITVAINTGKTSMSELRDVIDKEVEAWNKVHKEEV